MPIGQKHNADDSFFRDLCLCLLDTLESELMWVNRFSSGNVEVSVPVYYSLTGDERFLLDSFVDDVVSDNRYVELNTDKIPRGHLTMTGFDILSDRFNNPNVWLKTVIDDNEEIKKVLTKIKAIPLSVKFDLVILLANEIDYFKCSQAILDSFSFYRYIQFEYNYMNIDAMIILPDTKTLEFNREKNMAADNSLKLTMQFEVSTYYPAYRRPKTNFELNDKNMTWSNAFNYDGFKSNNKDLIVNPKKSKWWSNLLRVQKRNKE